MFSSLFEVYVECITWPGDEPQAEREEEGSCRETVARGANNSQGFHV